jgi:hypothetical protein
VTPSATIRSTKPADDDCSLVTAAAFAARLRREWATERFSAEVFVGTAAALALPHVAPPAPAAAVAPLPPHRSEAHVRVNLNRDDESSSLSRDPSGGSKSWWFVAAASSSADTAKVMTSKAAAAQGSGCVRIVTALSYGPQNMKINEDNKGAASSIDSFIHWNSCLYLS